MFWLTLFSVLWAARRKRRAPRRRRPVLSPFLGCFRSATWSISREMRWIWRPAPATPASVQMMSRSGGLSETMNRARRIGAVVGDDVVGVDHVLARLRHLLDRADLDLAGRWRSR